MSRKNLDTLRHEIDAAVHPTGGPPKVTAPALNAVLSSLATEVAAAGAPLQIVDYSAAIATLENAFYKTGDGGTRAFAVGDLVTQAGQGLYQCVQAFTVGFDGDQEDYVNNHYPSSSPAYWRVVQQRGEALFVNRNELNYKVARFGTGPNSSIVASPNLPHASTGHGASIVGGLDHTAAAALGTVVGGYRLALPEGADNSVVLGGHDFAAPARPNTVFAPRLVLWEKGATVELTDFNGNPHPLAVSTDGVLLLDGLPLAPNNVALPFVPLTGPDGSPYTLAVNRDGVLTLNGLAAAAAPTPVLKLTDQGGTPHVLTVTQAGALLIDGQPSGPPPAPAPTPLVSYTLQTNRFVEADPQSRRVPLESVLTYEQPADLPAPELRDGGFVVPRRGYYELTSRAEVGSNQLKTTESYSVCGGPEFDWRNQSWVDGSPALRNLVAYSTQRLLLEAGTVVYLYAQFAGKAAQVAGQLTVYLLHDA